MHLGCTAYALAHLGADEPALELEAAAASIAEAIGEPSVDKLMAKHVWVLDEARARVPQDRADARGPPRQRASGVRGRSPSSRAVARGLIGPASTGLIRAQARHCLSRPTALVSLGTGLSCDARPSSACSQSWRSSR